MCKQLPAASSPQLNCIQAWVALMRSSFHYFCVSVSVHLCDSRTVQLKHSSRISLAADSWKSTRSQERTTGTECWADTPLLSSVWWTCLVGPSWNDSYMGVWVEAKQMTAVGAQKWQRYASEKHYPSPIRDKWWASLPCKYLPQWITPQRRGSVRPPNLISRMPNQMAHGTNLPLSSCSEWIRTHTEAIETSLQGCEV